jgi:hypothetical protein
VVCSAGIEGAHLVGEKAAALHVKEDAAIPKANDSWEMGQGQFHLVQTHHQCGLRARSLGADHLEA